MTTTEPPVQRPAPSPNSTAGPCLPGEMSSHLHLDLFVGRDTGLASVLYPGRCTLSIGADATLYLDADELQRFREYLSTVAAALADATAAAAVSVAS